MTSKIEPLTPEQIAFCFRATLDDDFDTKEGIFGTTFVTRIDGKPLRITTSYSNSKVELLWHYYTCHHKPCESLILIDPEMIREIKEIHGIDISVEILSALAYEIKMTAGLVKPKTGSIANEGEYEIKLNEALGD